MALFIFNDYHIEIHPDGKFSRSKGPEDDELIFVVVTKESDSKYLVTVSAVVARNNQFYSDTVRVDNVFGVLDPIIKNVIVAIVFGEFSDTLCCGVINRLSRQLNWPRHELAVAEMELQKARETCKELRQQASEAERKCDIFYQELLAAESERDALRKRAEEVESELCVLKDRMGRSRDVAQWYFFNFGVEL